MKPASKWLGPSQKRPKGGDKITSIRIPLPIARGVEIRGIAAGSRSATDTIIQILAGFVAATPTPKGIKPKWAAKADASSRKDYAAKPAKKGKAKAKKVKAKAKSTRKATKSARKVARKVKAKIKSETVKPAQSTKDELISRVKAAAEAEKKAVANNKPKKKKPEPKPKTDPEPVSDPEPVTDPKPGPDADPDEHEDDDDAKSNRVAVSQTKSQGLTPALV